MGFFSNRRNKIMTKAINDAFLLNEGENTETRIHWEAAEKFAQDNGGKTERYSDGGQTSFFKMVLHDQEVSITLIRHRINRTVIINAENSEKQLSRFKKERGLR